MPDLSHIISCHYQHYLSDLKDLVAMPSVFTDREGMKQAIQYCRHRLEENLPGWHVYFDAKHNLIARPHTIDKQKDIIYLSAHIDTVDADASEWDESHNPFSPLEDEREIRGRGASDCKAGVAYELFLARLHARNDLNLDNIIFTITFNEEGSGDKTVTEIARNLGESLPVSESTTYVIVLENNVRAVPCPVLCIYDRERGNYVIKTKGTLEHLQTWIQKHSEWNPVCIYPDTDASANAWKTLHQESRHVCSVPRENNLLYRMLLDATPDTVLKAGQERNFGVVPASILIAKAPCPVTHSIILSNRSFDTLAQVQHQLQGLSYEEMKPFALSQGLDMQQELSQNPLKDILEDCRTTELDIELTHNVGCSDASILYNSVNSKLRESLLPIIMGPGTRSQPHAVPPRFTHGRNETLDKQSARKAMIYITEVLCQLKAISVVSPNQV
jgi:hypothetical protein